jgi:hypothetical protein
MSFPMLARSVLSRSAGNKLNQIIVGVYLLVLFYICLLDFFFGFFFSAYIRHSFVTLRAWTMLSYVMGVRTVSIICELKALGLLPNHPGVRQVWHQH